jgi:hypothetical protein
MSRISLIVNANFRTKEKVLCCTKKNIIMQTLASRQPGLMMLFLALAKDGTGAGE